MLQLTGRALTASSLDAELFVDREQELAAVEQARRLGFNVYVSGSPGSGATSLLHRVEAQAPGEMTFVNANDVTAFASLLARLAGAIAREDRRTVAMPEEGDVTDPIRPLREAATSSPASGRITLLLDGLDETLRMELFGRQRDELWELPLRWVVTGRSPVAAPADAFFETQLQLAPLSEADMRTLLMRRADGGTAEERALMTTLADALPTIMGPSTPRALLAAARAVVSAPDPEAALRSLRQRQTARAGLSDPEARVLAALDALGPTHAGDERLLDEVGTTRSRVVQVLRGLEEAGMVESTRQGRRVLYAAATAAGPVG